METNLNETEYRDRNRTHWAVWVVLFLLAVGNIYAIWSISDTNDRIAGMDHSLQASIATINEQTSLLGTRSDQTAAELRKSFEASLEKASQQARVAAGRAKTAAERQAAQLVEKLAEETRAKSTEITSEIGQVKESASSAHQKFEGLMTDVTSVRGDVTQTRTDLDATRNELKSVRGDLGVQSGLIATNAKELAALRELGERQYFEFEAPKGKPVNVGNVSLNLRRVKPKDNKFSLYVVADDKRVEKKDRTINEPIQFYTGGSRLPYEIVINEVKKDRIVGYMAVPKVQPKRES